MAFPGDQNENASKDAGVAGVGQGFTHALRYGSSNCLSRQK
jgi:hypothetical protein